MPPWLACFPCLWPSNGGSLPPKYNSPKAFFPWCPKEAIRLQALTSAWSSPWVARECCMLGGVLYSRTPSRRQELSPVQTSLGILLRTVVERRRYGSPFARGYHLASLQIDQPCLLDVRGFQGRIASLIASTNRSAQE